MKKESMENPLLFVTVPAGTKIEAKWGNITYTMTTTSQVEALDWDAFDNMSMKIRGKPAPIFEDRGPYDRAHPALSKCLYRNGTLFTSTKMLLSMAKESGVTAPVHLYFYEVNRVTTITNAPIEGKEHTEHLSLYLPCTISGTISWNSPYHGLPIATVGNLLQMEEIRHVVE